MTQLEPTIIYSSPELEAAAFYLCDKIRATEVINISQVNDSAHYNAILFLVDAKSDLSEIWQLISSKITTIPILFYVNDRLWHPDILKNVAFLERPFTNALSTAFDTYEAIFLSAHGRSDSISLKDGKLCGGIFRSVAQHYTTNIALAPDQFIPSCVKTGQCYRPNMEHVSMHSKKTKLLFTNSCEAFSYGKDSAIGSQWTVHEEMAKNQITLVGTPFVRNSISQEIQFAEKLFEFGLPLWQVVHIINYGNMNAGFDTHSLVIRGNPLIRLDTKRKTKRCKATNKLTINNKAQNEFFLRIPIKTHSLGKTIIGEAGHFLYMVAPFHPMVDEEILIIGRGIAKISFNKPPGGLNNIFAILTSADSRWKKIEILLSPTAQEGGLRKRWQDIMSNIRNIYLVAQIDATISAKMRQRLIEAKNIQSDLEQCLVTRLAEQASKKTPRCPIDYSRSRLTFGGNTEKTVCPACGRKAILMQLEFSWKSLRCPRCGIVSLQNEKRLIKKILIPQILFPGETYKISVVTESNILAATIYRGEHEGIIIEQIKKRMWEMKISNDVKPHFYYLRIYAIHDGVFEAAHRLIQVEKR